MWTIATDIVLTYRGLCVCLLVTTVSCAKTAEPIEMPFGGRADLRGVDSGNHVLGGSWTPPGEYD